MKQLEYMLPLWNPKKIEFRKRFGEVVVGLLKN